jgi:hypothetical protein
MRKKEVFEDDAKERTGTKQIHERQTNPSQTTSTEIHFQLNQNFLILYLNVIILF